MLGFAVLGRYPEIKPPCRNNPHAKEDFDAAICMAGLLSGETALADRETKRCSAGMGGSASCALNTCG